MAASSKKALELFVSRVPWTVATMEFPVLHHKIQNSKMKEIREYFGQFGAVRKCLLPFDRESGFHRGFCWVGFSSEEGLNNALQKESHIIEGTKVQVQKNKRTFVQRPNRDED